MAPHRRATPPRSTTEDTTEDTTEPLVIDVTIKGESVTPNGERFDVNTGQEVQLDVTADAPGEIHVHSTPEQELEYDEGESTLTIEGMDRPGTVDVEVHEPGQGPRPARSQLTPSARACAGPASPSGRWGQVPGLPADGVLHHHVVVFVHQVVAVHHVATAVRTEPDKHAHGLVLPDVGGVLGSALVVEGRPTVAAAGF